MDNGCEAGIRLWGDTLDMKRAFIAALEGRRATVRHFWEASLRRVPVSTPLANPDALVFMMDETMDALFAAARSRSLRHWLVADPVAHIQSSASFRCGFNPLAAYFLAGESALVSTCGLIKAEPPLTENGLLNSQRELLFVFRVLAHRELNAFCDVCVVARSKDAPGAETKGPWCPRLSIPPSPAGSPKLPGASPAIEELNNNIHPSFRNERGDENR
jgi:hypothetical protein